METLLLKDLPLEKRLIGLEELRPPAPDFAEDLDTFQSPEKESGTLFHRFKAMINKPWSADPAEIPEIRSPIMSGNSVEPFYRAAETNEEIIHRNRIIRYIKSHRSVEPLSDWSSIFHTNVPVRNLPSDVEGFRLGHIADIHVSIENERTLIELENFAAWLSLQEQKLDALVLAGDIIKHHPRDLTPRALAAFSLIAETVPEAYFVLGNHDYYAFQEEKIIRLMECAGWKYLGNDVASRISGKRFHIHGVDDAIHGKPLAPIAQAPEDFNLLLTHNLDAIRANCEDHFDFILSGHTHWGESRILQGEILMWLWDHNDNVNAQTRGWKMLTNRALSYVQPGLERHYVKSSYLRIPAGFSIHTLTDAEQALAQAT